MRFPPHNFHQLFAGKKPVSRRVKTVNTNKNFQFWAVKTCQLWQNHAKIVQTFDLFNPFRQNELVFVKSLNHIQSYYGYGIIAYWILLISYLEVTFHHLKVDFSPSTREAKSLAPGRPVLTLADKTATIHGKTLLTNRSCQSLSPLCQKVDREAKRKYRKYERVVVFFLPKIHLKNLLAAFSWTWQSVVHMSSCLSACTLLAENCCCIPKNWGNVARTSAQAQLTFSFGSMTFYHPSWNW